MKLALGAVAALALAGCASDPYYSGTYGYGPAPAHDYGTTYYYDYGYPTYGYPAIGGGVVFQFRDDDDRRGRRWADRDHGRDGRWRDRDGDGRWRDRDGDGRWRGRDGRHDFGGRGGYDANTPPGQLPGAQGR